VADLCEACGVDAAAAGAFAAGLGPGQRHEASGDEVGVLQDQGVLAAPAVVMPMYRGPVTAVGGGVMGAKYVGQDGEAVGPHTGNDNLLVVKFADGDTSHEGGGDAFFSSHLKARSKNAVLLLDGEGAAALLRHCGGGGGAGAAEALGAFLADAANAGLYQATHLSLQESECAEAFRAAASPLAILLAAQQEEEAAKQQAAVVGDLIFDSDEIRSEGTHARLLGRYSLQHGKLVARRPVWRQGSGTEAWLYYAPAYCQWALVPVQTGSGSRRTTGRCASGRGSRTAR
jgi:hypothetical protein